MIEVHGDLWEYPAALRVITTNGVVNDAGENVMGKGCARQARVTFRGLAKALGTLIDQGGNHVHLLRDFGTREWCLASFPVKAHWSKPAELALIERSARELRALVDAEGFASVVVPRPGCGNGLCDWARVKPILAQIFDDRFAVITYPPRIAGMRPPSHRDRIRARR